MEQNITKITKPTLKSFVRKNTGRLHVWNLSDFDGMTDCVQQCEGSGFRPATPSDIKNSESHTLGIAGVWLVGQSRDSFNPYNNNGFTGIEVYNSCGNFVIAVPDKAAPPAACGISTLCPDDLIRPCVLPLNHGDFCSGGVK